MYKNPSLYTTAEIVQRNLKSYYGQEMTVTCLIMHNGVMVLYDSIDEMMRNFKDIPDSQKMPAFFLYLKGTSTYFCNTKFEYIPNRLATPEMEARIMQWKIALSISGVTPTSARIENHAGQSLISASKLISDEKIYNQYGAKYHNGDMEFLKSCNASTALVDRYDFMYNDVGMYCIKSSTFTRNADPCVMFKDTKSRPAVIRKGLSKFISVYAEYMRKDDEFEVFVYPDGTAANMSEYSTFELETEISDDELDEYLKVIDLPRDLTDLERFYFRLQLMRIVCIVGNDTIILPYPITPQQSVFLEGLQEMGYVTIDESNIKRLTTIHDKFERKFKSRIPLQMSNGFMLGGTSCFSPYYQLSPGMKKRVDDVMNLTDETRRKYLFDATIADRIFVVDSEEEI